MVLNTDIFGQGLYLNFWIEEGRIFFLIYICLSSHSAPAPDTASSHSGWSSPRGVPSFLGEKKKDPGQGMGKQGALGIIPPLLEHHPRVSRAEIQHSQAKRSKA